MQAFVPRSDLLNETAETPVRVVASYGNAMVTTIDMHGPDCTVLFLAEDLTKPPDIITPTTLKPEWRTNYAPVLNFEAARRITIAFPEYKQRNYTALMNDYTFQYGADTALWPQTALDDKAENDRGWAYVQDVRAASNAWTSMPVDPTDDSIWPPAITPIK